MITGVRLVNGDNELILYPRTDLFATSLDVASPAVREVTQARTDDDGERDTTQYIGARAVSLQLDAFDDVDLDALLDEIKGYLYASTRPYLYVTRDGWAQERRIGLRVDQWSEPYAGPAAGRVQPVQLQWRAPDGLWESVDIVTETLNADVPADIGITFPASFPISFDPTTASGTVTITNPGTAPAHFVARMYGPCTAPTLRNETTGEEITFTSSLVLAAGEYVEVTTRDRSAYLLSNTALSRLAYVDWAVTSWWRLAVGDQGVRYTAGHADPGAVAVLEYRPAWL